MPTITSLESGFAISMAVNGDSYVFAYTSAKTQNEAIEQFLTDMQGILTALQTQLN